MKTLLLSIMPIIENKAEGPALLMKIKSTTIPPKIPLKKPIKKFLDLIDIVNNNLLII